MMIIDYYTFIITLLFTIKTNWLLFFYNNFKGPGHSHWFDWGHTGRGASKPRRLWKKGNH